MAEDLDRLTVEELDERIKSNPNNVDLNEALADALLDRYLDGDENHGPGGQTDITRLKQVLLELPQEKAFYARAYVAYLDSKDKEAVEWLKKYSRGNDPSNPAEPFTADDLYLEIVEPFHHVSKEFWALLASSFEKLWPESPASLVLAGYVKEDNEQLDEAFDRYDLALNKDKHYWIADWGLGKIHYLRKNWREAAHYYEKTLHSEVARSVPELHFQSAWCLGKLRKHADEEKHYRICLDLNPEMPSARNNLGWSLYRQGRLAEALEVFDDCIRRQVDGAYPVRNRAKTLARLGRFAEAIDAWKQTGRGGRLSRNAQEQINRLQARISRGDEDRLTTQDEDEVDDDGDYQGDKGK